MLRNRLLQTLFATYWVFLAGTAYFSYLVPLRIFHHALVTLLLGWWLARQVRRGGLPATPLTLPLMAGLGVGLGAAAVSIDPRTSLEWLWPLVVHAVIFLAFVGWVRAGGGAALVSIQFLLGGLVVMISAVELASWFFGLGLLPGTDVGWWWMIREHGVFPAQVHRPALALNISTLVAGYIAPLVVLAFGWGAAARQRPERWALWGVAGVFMLLLLLTQSRGGVLGVIAGGGVLLALYVVSQLGLNRARIIQTAGLLAVVAVIGVVAVFAFTRGGGRVSGDEKRLDMWRSAVEMTQDAPLSGVGPGQFGRAYRDYWVREYSAKKHASAHNVYLNIAAETGVIGVAASIWIAMAFAFAFWRGRGQLPPRKRLQVDTACAALVVIMAHSLFDVFNQPPMLLMMALLAAFVIGTLPSTPPGTSSGRRALAAVVLGVVGAYGAGLLLSDRAQRTYQRSLQTGDLALARQAATQDPYLNLYKLHIAQLLGERAFPVDTAPVPDDVVNAAITAYEEALALEPHWDIGWLNLAALEEKRGNLDRAYAYAQTASEISYENPASIHMARYAEQIGGVADATVIDLTHTALAESGSPPLAPYWWETDVRRQAVTDYVATWPEVQQYQVYRQFDTERALALVPQAPQTAEGWMITGYSSPAPQQRYDAFDRAIALAPANGDAYLQRGWAAYRLGHDVAQVRRDAEAAAALGTWYEKPAVLLAQLTEDPAQRQGYLLAAGPTVGVPQFLAAVMYNGRPGALEPLPPVRFTPPPADQLAPWYRLADLFLSEGNAEAAASVYQLILHADWQQAEARAALLALMELRRGLPPEQPPPETASPGNVHHQKHHHHPPGRGFFG